MLPNIADVSILDAVSLNGVDKILHDFAQIGIELNSSGRIASGSEPRLDLRRRLETTQGARTVQQL